MAPDWFSGMPIELRPKLFWLGSKKWVQVTKLRSLFYYLYCLEIRIVYCVCLQWLTGFAGNKRILLQHIGVGSSLLTAIFVQQAKLDFYRVSRG